MASSDEIRSPDKRLVRPDGHKIVDLRRSRGWGQRVFAVRVGIAPRTLERAEAGRPTFITTISAIAGAFGLQPNDLMISTEGARPPVSPKRPFVFLSYSHDDKRFAENFCERLRTAGIHYFRDVKSIPFGGNIPDKVHEALQQATHLVVLVSPSSAKSQWVPYEMGYAKGRNVVLIPYLMHAGMDPPPFIASQRYLQTLEEEAEFIATLVEDLKRFTLQAGH
jgi:transcriptional regulator with XRE-family HTH domain